MLASTVAPPHLNRKRQLAAASSTGGPGAYYLPSPPSSISTKLFAAAVAGGAKTHLPLLVSRDEDDSDSPVSSSPLKANAALKFNASGALVTVPSSAGPVRTHAGIGRDVKENVRLVSGVTARLRGPNVAFSPVLLGSLQARPHHRTLRYQPYSKHAAPSPLQRIYSPGISPLASTLSLVPTPLQTTLRRDLDDSDSDDEIQQLLLAKTATLSPPREDSSLSPASAAPYWVPGPKSILKEYAHHLNALSSNTAEGSRRNEGRRKHALNFSEHDLVPTQALAKGGEVSGKSSGGLSASAGDSHSGPSARTGADVKGKGKATTPGGSGEDDIGNDPPSSNPHEHSNPVLGSFDLPLTDPLHFLSPLLVLDASLHRASAHCIRALAPVDAPTSDDSTMQDEDTSLPILLAEVELAYLALTRALLRLPHSMAEDQLAISLQPLVTYKGSLLKVLEREIVNMTPSSTPVGEQEEDMVPPSSSPLRPATAPAPIAGTVRSPGARKITQGLSAQGIRKQKDEVAACQAAIKCFAAFSGQPRFYNLLKREELSHMLETLINIPLAADMTPAVAKELYPFCSFYFSTQRLQPALLSPFVPAIVETVRRAMITHDKLRRNFSEGMTAINRLLMTHPRQVLAAWKTVGEVGGKGWFVLIVEALCEQGKYSIMVRSRAALALGFVVKGLHGPYWSGAEEVVKGIRYDIGEAFLAILKDPFQSTNPDDLSGFGTLEGQLSTILDPKDPKTEDAFWALSVLAILPALLGGHFRRLTPRGVKPWSDLVLRASINPSASVRLLSQVVWSHLIFAFLQYSRKMSGDWLFDHKGRRALALLCQTPKVFVPAGGEQPEGLGPNPLLMMPGYIHGLSLSVRRYRSINPESTTSPIPTLDQELSDLNDIWLVLTKDLAATFAAPRSHPAHIDAAWYMLSRVLSPVTDDVVPVYALLNGAILEGAVVRARTPKQQTDASILAVSKVLRSEQVSGWPVRWIVCNLGRVLQVFDDCLTSSKLSRDGTRLKWTRGGTVIPTTLLTTWENLMHSLSQAEPQLLEEGLPLVFDFISNLYNAAPGLDNCDVTATLLESCSRILGSALYLHSQFSSFITRLQQADCSWPVESAAQHVFAGLAEAIMRLDPRDTFLAAQTRHALPLLHSGQYDQLHSVIIERWSSTCESASSSMSADVMSAVLAFICLEPSNSPSIVNLTLAAKVVNHLSIHALSTPVLWLRFQAGLLIKGTSACEGLKLLLISMQQSNAAAASQILEVVMLYLSQIRVGPLQDLLDTMSMLLSESRGQGFVTLLEHCLMLSTPLLQPTSSHLEMAAPMLELALNFAFAHEFNSATTRDSALRLVHDFWTTTFQRADDDDFIIPDSLLLPLAALRKVKPDIMMHNVESQSQTQSTQVDMTIITSQEPLASFQPPPAAQERSSVPPEDEDIEPETTAMDVDGEETRYAADVSATQLTSSTLSTIDTDPRATSPFVPTAAPLIALAPPSPSLGAFITRQIPDSQFYGSPMPVPAAAASPPPPTPVVPAEVEVSHQDHSLTFDDIPVPEVGKRVMPLRQTRARITNGSRFNVQISPSPEPEVDMESPEEEESIVESQVERQVTPVVERPTSRVDKMKKRRKSDESESLVSSQTSSEPSQTDFASLVPHKRLRTKKLRQAAVLLATQKAQPDLFVRRRRSTRATEREISPAPVASQSSSPSESHASSQDDDPSYEYPEKSSANRSGASAARPAKISPLVSFQIVSSPPRELTPLAPPPPPVPSPPAPTPAPRVESPIPVKEQKPLQRDENVAAMELLFSLSNEQIVKTMEKVGGMLGLKKMIEWGKIAQRSLDD